MAEVIVVGATNIDIKAKTIEPNRLGTSNPGMVSTAPGGVGRNIAHNLARLGADVALLSVVGSDAHGDAVLLATAGAGVDVSRVQRSKIATGSYVALIDHDGELITAINDMRGVDGLTWAAIAENTPLLKAAKFVVADCNLPLDTLMALAAQFGHKLLIEPVSVPKSQKLREVLKAHAVFLASPNFDQIEQMTGSRDIADAFEFLKGNGLRQVVVHAGPEGAFVWDGMDIHHVEARPPPHIVDVTGAGDAAVSGLVHGLLRGEPLTEAAARGQELAGRVIATVSSTLE